MKIEDECEETLGNVRGISEETLKSERGSFESLSSSCIHCGGPLRHGSCTECGQPREALNSLNDVLGYSTVTRVTV